MLSCLTRSHKEMAALYNFWVNKFSPAYSDCKSNKVQISTFTFSKSCVDVHTWKKLHLIQKNLWIKLSSKEKNIVFLSKNCSTLQHTDVRWHKIHWTHFSLSLSWVLSYRSGSGDRVWSPTLSEDGKTSPYLEHDSQVTIVYSGFPESQVTSVWSDFN